MARKAKRLRRSLAAAALLAGSLALTAPPAEVHAQDDWSVNSSDRKAKMIERYKKLVNRSAEETYAFKQLMKNVGRGQDYDALIEEYRGKVEKDPDNYRWRMLLGHMLRYGDSFDEALKEYEAAAGLKETALVFESIGQLHEDNKRLDEAITSYEKALELSDEKAQKERILRAMGAIALHRRHLDKAKGYFQRLVDLDPRDIFVRRELANLLIEYRQFDEALAQLRAAEEIAGRNKATRLQLQLAIGEVYEKMGEDDKAVELYRKAARQVKAGTALAIEFEERIIVIYRRKNNLHGLIAYYEENWSRPNFNQLMILSRLYEETGDLAKATEYIKKAIRKNGRNADARLKLVQLLERAGDLEAIIEAYEDLIDAVPRDARYRFDLANLLFRNQRKDEAIAILKKTGRSFKRDADVHVRLADMYINWDMREEALDEYKLLVKLQPREPGHLENLGEYYYQEGDKEKALDTWKKIVKVVREKEQGHAYLGRVYADHNMTREAIEQYKKAIEIAPRNYFIQRELAETYERARQFPDALAAWQKILDESEDAILEREARQHIINIHHGGTNTLPTVIRQYERKFEREPPDIEAGYFLAEAYLKLKDLESAAKVLERVLSVKENDMEALVQLEKVYAELGEYTKAIEILEKLADVDALRARVYYQKIAEAYLKLGDNENAELAMLRSIQVNANDASAFAKLGDVYIKKGEWNKAAEQYEEAIRVDPRAFNHFFVLAEIYIQLDRPSDADKLYRRVVRGAIEEGMILRAANRSITINSFADTMEDLEKDFMPLMNAVPKRPVYDKILVELYSTMSRKHRARARSGDPETRAAARAELEKIGLRAIKPLLDALHDDDMSRKDEAITLLGELGNPNAALPLSVFLEHDSTDVRVEAALALGKLGNERVVEPLAATAARDSALRPIRELATWGLGRSESAAAVPHLVKLAGYSPIYSVKALALIGLGRIGEGGEEVVTELLGHANPTIRSAAAWSAGQLGLDATAATLRELLKSNRDEVASMAAWSLGAFDDPRSLEALLAAYWSPRPAVRQAAARGIMRMAHAEPIPNAYSLWEENTAFVSQTDATFDVDINGLITEIVAAQAELTEDADVSALLEAHADTVASVITQRLKVTDAKVVDAVLRDLDRDDTRLSLGAITHGLPADHPALDTIGQAFVAELRLMLASPVPTHRWHAASLLGKIGDAQAVPVLINALEDESRDVRRKAALALGRIGDAAAYAPLLSALESDAFGVRAHAAWGLGMLGDARAVDALSPLLEDDYTYVQGYAVRGLGATGDPRAVDLLSGRIDGAAPSVQVEMIDALATLGATGPIERLKDSPDPAVRERAREVLAKP